MTNVLALPAGSELVGDFRIERVLGAGGFGITYLAEEIALQRLVTVKEYFPTDFAARGEGQTAVPRDTDAAADFKWGLDRFIDEAQILARFDHPNIVKVYRYFRANDTAYMVLHFEEGQSLKAWLKGLKRAPRQRELDDLVRPLLDALDVIHAADYLHRDIAPDNIILRTDGSPVLIDFGSARGEIARHSRTVSALVKPGYSPYEQYAENGVRQGPWTDIYALGATLYHAIAGKRPADAPSRVVKDDMPPARDAALSSYRPGFLMAVDRALALDTTRRPQSIAAWRGELLAPDPSRPGWLRRTLRPGSTPASGSALPKTKVLTRQPGSPPPPPDMPGPGGGLLDYIENMKRQAQAEAPSEQLAAMKGAAASAGSTGGKPADASAPPQPEPQAAPAERRKRGWGAARKSPPAEPARARKQQPAPPQRKPPRPKAVRTAGRRRGLSFALTMLMGLGIVGGAIALQDRARSSNASGASRTSSDSKGGSGVSLADVSRLITGSIMRSQPLRAVAGHTGGTGGVAYTGDGRALVTSGADGALKVWDASSGALLRSLRLEDGAPTSLAVRGRRALTGHADGAVQMWDVDTGTRLGRFKRNEANVWSLAFASDPDHFVASGHDWKIALWDARKADNPLAVIEAHENAVQAVAFSPEGPWIATGGADKAVKLWRADDLSLVRTYRGHKEYVTSIAFSPDGRYLAAAAIDGRIRVWRTSSRGLYRMNSQHSARVTSLAFSPDGETLASADDDGAVQLWQFKRSRSTTRDIAEEGPAAKALAFSPDGKRIAVASGAGKVQLLDTSPAPRSRRQ